MPLCCWLLPPQPNYAVLEALISRAAQAHNLPNFAPHLTLLAGIPEAEAQQKLLALAGSGTVSVRFAAVATRPPWNQYIVVEAEETSDLCRAQRLARQTFFGTPEAEAKVAWALPLGKPHLSLAYGADLAAQLAIADAMPLPESFVATEVCLVECTPATLEGVPQWKEVGRVCLSPDSQKEH